MAIETTPVEAEGELANEEFEPTREQFIEVDRSCAARALQGEDGLSPQDRKKLQARIDAVQEDLATSLDTVRDQRSRIKIQRVLLEDEAKSIGAGQKNVTAMTSLAARAVSACLDVAQTIQGAKTGTDRIFIKQNELEYRQQLIEIFDSKLSGVEDKISDTIERLDRLSAAAGI